MAFVLAFFLFTSAIGAEMERQEKMPFYGCDFDSIDGKIKYKRLTHDNNSTLICGNTVETHGAEYYIPWQQL